MFTTMNLSELKAGQGKVDVVVLVKSKAEPRQFEKYGRPLRVCNSVVSDDSGEMSMTLWNDDIDKINVGDSVKITNGYVSEFNGTKQLSAGKFGKLEVVNGSAVASNGSSKPAKESKPKKAVKEEKEEAEEFEEVEF